VLRGFFTWEPGSGVIFERVGEVPRAFAAVSWWRSQHAEPLSKTATSLRYHVARAEALVDGRVDVTQRLKRTVTIGDKLSRGSVAANAYYGLMSRAFALVERGREIPVDLATELQLAHARIRGVLPMDDAS
jgi:hypothetical protein